MQRLWHKQKGNLYLLYLHPKLKVEVCFSFRGSEHWKSLKSYMRSYVVEAKRTSANTPFASLIYFPDRTTPLFNKHAWITFTFGIARSWINKWGPSRTAPSFLLYSLPGMRNGIPYWNAWEWNLLCLTKISTVYVNY